MLFSEIDFDNQKVLFEATNKTGSNMTYRVYIDALVNNRREYFINKDLLNLKVFK